MILFHGGCHGCTMQDGKGLGYCTGCQMFEADWSKPDLNDESKRRKEKMDSIRALARKMANEN